MSKLATELRTLLLLALVAIATGATAGGVTLRMEQATVEEVFLQIKKQTGYNFVISGEVAKSLPRVNVDVKDKDVRDVLNTTLSSTGCTYDINGRTITVYRQQDGTGSRTVSGTVRDEQGEPLVGVPVSVGDGRVSTVTDANGHYSLKVPAGPCVLKLTYVGMKAQTVTLAQGGDVKRDIVMTGDTQLKDVVVTGIFKKARESYTGSVSTISKEELTLNRGQNLLQTLKSIDASLNFQVNNLAGSNPNNLPQINIRGNSSLPMSVAEFNTSTGNSVNTPLIILDGFEMSLEKLMDYNDEEIESINILKDAAATAIYGSRGSNGVIVVTTRQPDAGKLFFSDTVLLHILPDCFGNIRKNLTSE